MDTLNAWLRSVSESPAGSVFLFIVAFVARISFDEYMRRHDRRRKTAHHKPKPKPKAKV